MSLALSPDKLIRIEFGCVRGEAVNVQPGAVFSEVLVHQLSTMDRSAIPHQHDRSAQVPQQVAQELHDLYTGDVLSMELHIQTCSPMVGRNGEGGDRRDPVPPIAVVQDGRFPPWRPCPSNRRDQEEPAFVHECEIRAEASRFFLSRGHSFRFHSSIATSSLCVARRSGFCALQFRSTTKSRQTADTE